MQKPQLLHKNLEGATIHSYDIMGGKTTFHHFLGCQQGSCTFYKTEQEAKKALKF